MRVAHFIQRYPPALGGSEAYFARLSRYLADQGNDVTVYTTSALDLSAFWSSRARCVPPGMTVDDGVKVRRYGLLRWPARRWFLKPLSLIPIRRWQNLTLPCNPIAPAMWRDAGRLDCHFDIVHATTFPYAFPIAAGLRLARRLRVPFALTPFLHLGDPADPRDPVRRSYTSPALMSLVRRADAVFVQTPSEREALLQRGIPGNKLTLLGLGVDPAECTGGNREKVRTQWKVNPDEVVIGHLANNSVEKGTTDLLSAANCLWERGIRFCVVLAGPEMPNFLRFWNRFRARGTVHRLGVLSDDQKRDFFAGIDVFALPSRSDSFGLVLLEAWANRVPNIAYRAGGIADVIHDQSDGLLIPCGDVSGLANGIERLVRDRSLRECLATEGDRRVHQDFQWGDKLRTVRDIYRRLTNDSQ
jgi:glycosyltransferase involved in cell wall biosynthesis